MVSSAPRNCFVMNPRLTGSIFRRPLGHFPFAFGPVLQAGGWPRTLWADLNEEAVRYQRFRFMTESRSLLSTLSIDPLASLGFCPMRGSDGFRSVFERSLPLPLKLSVAPRSRAPLVVTSDGPPIELPTPCQSAWAAEVASNTIITVIVLIIAPSACRLVGSG
jgi:hypothetical protein